ncbi:MAG: hypothetical protein ABIV48_09270, partial [Pyrinomonadaceae bacterium]
AGLFPPAVLPISNAVANYASYRNSNYRWMLGRFLLSVAQLPDFIERADEFISQDTNSVWRLSVLSSEDIIDTIRKAQNFNMSYGPDVIIDSIEVRANTVSKIENTILALPKNMRAYFEVDLGDNFPDLIAKLAACGQYAKIRTGGVTPDDFPSTKAIIRFVRSCLAANVPFKATAGLHHPIRCFRPLTFDDSSPEGTMHGFLNMFLMTAFAREGYRLNLLEGVMEDEFDEVFRFEDQFITWRDEYSLTIRQIETVRLKGIHSFGSCSFEEPIADLRKMGIL